MLKTDRGDTVEDYLDITPADLADRVTIKLYADEEVRNPREDFDHAGTLYCETRDLNLSDKGASLPATAGYSSRFSDIAVAARWIELHGGVAVPVRCDDYGSSGARAYTSDAENANGLIWCEMETIHREWARWNVEDSKAAALECLTAEIEELDQYLSGDVYGYVIETPDGDLLDSCWGFYGQSYATTEAVEAGHHAVAELDNRANRLTAARSWAFSRLFGAVV
jgi:hypothetical protein